MKNKKAIRHRIDQKTALRKKARQRRRHLFRLAAKANRVQVVETTKEAQTREIEKKGITTYGPKRP